MCAHTRVDMYSSLGINVTKNDKHIAHCKSIATLKSPTAFGFCTLKKMKLGGCYVYKIQTCNWN